jgi:hypothetical protein
VWTILVYFRIGGSGCALGFYKEWRISLTSLASVMYSRGALLCGFRCIFFMFQKRENPKVKVVIVKMKDAVNKTHTAKFRRASDLVMMKDLASNK